MDSIGIDLRKRESQLCTITEAGELLEQRIVTSRERFTAVLGARPAAHILLEASTESEWVARHLEALGHVVIVADPGFAAMYATRSKRVKTDKRGTRTRCIALIKAAVRREGLRLPSGEAEQTVAKLAALPLPTYVPVALAPLVAGGARSRRRSRRPTRGSPPSRGSTPWWCASARGLRSAP